MLPPNQEIKMLPGLSEWKSPVSASEGVCMYGTVQGHSPKRNKFKKASRKKLVPKDVFQER